jgi:hypothetical protein
MRKITFGGAFWNQQRSRIFSAGQEIADPSGEVIFRIVSGSMRILQRGTRNQLFFTNQDSTGRPVGTGVLLVLFRDFLSRQIHLTVSGSDSASTTPLSIAFNYTNNPNMLYFGTAIRDDPANPGAYSASRDFLVPTNRLPVANVAFLTDKAENNLREFSYDVSVGLISSVRRVNSLLGELVRR